MYKNQKKEYEGYKDDEGKIMAAQFAHGNIAYNIEPLSNGLVQWSAWPKKGAQHLAVQRVASSADMVHRIVFSMIEFTDMQDRDEDHLFFHPKIAANLDSNTIKVFSQVNKKTKEAQKVMKHALLDSMGKFLGKFLCEIEWKWAESTFYGVFEHMVIMRFEYYGEDNFKVVLDKNIGQNFLKDNGLSDLSDNDVELITDEKGRELNQWFTSHDAKNLINDSEMAQVISNFMKLQKKILEMPLREPYGPWPILELKDVIDRVIDGGHLEATKRAWENFKNKSFESNSDKWKALFFHLINYYFPTEFVDINKVTNEQKVMTVIAADRL